jgi:hypothetical protein
MPDWVLDQATELVQLADLYDNPRVAGQPARR